MVAKSWKWHRITTGKTASVAKLRYSPSVLRKAGLASAHPVYLYLLTFIYPCAACGGVGKPKILIMLS